MAAHMHPYPRPNGQYPVAAPQPPIPNSDGSLPPISARPNDDTYNPMVPYQHVPTQQAPANPDPLVPYKGRKGDYTYSLIVEQQPIRARMCGFGDKDRRPITPPPCIRLVVWDNKANKEVNYHDIDSSYFVLSVDLFAANGKEEVNLVRHATSGSTHLSISQSPTTAYPAPPDRQQMYGAPTYDSYGRPMMPPQAPAYGQPQPQMGSPAASYPNTYAPQGQYGTSLVPMSPVPVVAPPPSATGMYTRNLIGSLTVNASKLNDTKKQLGLWFVLQDLSVRTEGTFRLKMNFIDVGSGQNNGHVLNKGRAPVLATCFSEPFQVFSAKKFPGVIESTPLSKAFASQGIKIPIRKDAPKTLANQAEYDADEI
ncbi:uncharacterized protein EI97DRAFT_409455 [Westerdykella ornata]|uniref:Velvet domain-containing protein n=1 Tax=Westerdykella ornata TaxID=318751 RepID=A0A6A6JWM7_WESOR|nr:uncharacterized protein EI97DRAFT_409455 [Westerdykella ornata]KAF2281012.1 hypothetical protein EI97DRAFT_409455 [Westerdykella ornata]